MTSHLQSGERNDLPQPPGLRPNNQVLNVKRDATPPTVNPAPARPPDANGWYNRALTVTFSGTDATSQIASCTQATYGGPDSPNTSVSGSCQRQCWKSDRGELRAQVRRHASDGHFVPGRTGQPECEARLECSGCELDPGCPHARPEGRDAERRLQRPGLGEGLHRSQAPSRPAVPVQPDGHRRRGQSEREGARLPRPRSAARSRPERSRSRRRRSSSGRPSAALPTTT